MTLTAEGIIFDVDGTFYPAANDLPFSESAVGKAVHTRTLRFFAGQFGLDEASAAAYYAKFREDHPGSLSKALEKVHGISRKQYYDATWNIDPHDHVPPQPNLRNVLLPIRAKRAILSGAPSIWASRVLSLLNITDQFDPRLFTGECQNKKPQVEVFLEVAEHLGIDPHRMVSIGDQEHTDIKPALAVGMTAVRIAAINTPSEADFVAPNIAEAINKLATAAIIQIS